MVITTACSEHENFIMLLSAWALSPVFDELSFTTISLNKNYAGRLHRDSGNFGPSIGLGERGETDARRAVAERNTIHTHRDIDEARRWEAGRL